MASQWRPRLTLYYEPMERDLEAPDIWSSGRTEMGTAPQKHFTEAKSHGNLILASRTYLANPASRFQRDQQSFRSALRQQVMLSDPATNTIYPTLYSMASTRNRAPFFFSISFSYFGGWQTKARVSPCDLDLHPCFSPASSRMLSSRVSLPATITISVPNFTLNSAQKSLANHQLTVSFT